MFPLFFQNQEALRSNAYAGAFKLPSLSCKAIAQCSAGIVRCNEPTPVDISLIRPRGKRETQRL